MFGNLSEIIPHNPETWQSRRFMTFDIDWCHDEVLEDTIELVEKANIAATWFITHHTSCIERLRANPKFELGIHPNFNDLLQGDFRNGKTAEEVVDRLLEIVPEAKSVRSHSMTQSSRLLDLFANKGLTHDANHFIPLQAGISLKPYIHWNGMIKVPYCWEDDVAIIYEDFEPSQALSSLMVFDFHPIHVFLNTEQMDRYERTRHEHGNPSKLKGYRFDGVGSRDYLQQLMGLI